MIFDADNDGLSDLFVCNGIYHDVTDQDFIEFFANDIVQKMVMTGKKEEVDNVIDKMPSTPIPNMAFRNTGNLKFKNEAADWGLDQPSFSNGAAYGDLDNDGDLDLVVNNVNQKAFIYKNNSREAAKSSYIGVKLKGLGANTFAIGSTIKVFQDGQVLTREVIPSRGFQSSVDYKIIIGLGNKKVDSMQVIWPDRTFMTIHKPSINQVHLLEQSTKGKFFNPGLNVSNALFDSVKQSFDKHDEDVFVDFYYERGLPMMLSHEGPKAAKGDVNGDGLTDIFICGAARQPGQLYLQTAKGFVKKEQPAFETFAELEGVAALFFDADKDGDLDLIVGAGGNRFSAQSQEYKNLLYRNDGKGNFEAMPNAIPFSGFNTSVLAANDYDSDGDLDLFIGSRSVPHSYGLMPASFLYNNNGSGTFTDVSASVFPLAANLGMVTSAVWTDLDNDKKNELVVAGEWSSPRIFTVRNSKVEEQKNTLAGFKGWWKSIVPADLDNDGDNDLVLGNLGENFYFTPSADKPVKMFVKDFDGNGSVEKIFTSTIDGKDKPIFLKKDLTDQIASLRKQNLKYSDYASKSVQDLFTPEQFETAIEYTFNYPSSCIAWNEGEGKFTVQKLPMEVQLSCVNAILASDINDDGKLDLLMGGNDFNFLPQFSQLDASYGHVLLNKGNRVFTITEKPGVNLKGEIKDIVEIDSKLNRQYLFLQNNNYPVLYRFRTKTK